MSRSGRWIIALLAIPVILVVSACGGSSSGSSSGGTAQGVTDSAIKLGFTGPFSGPIAAAGREESGGIKAALNEVNEEGGINGRKIELVTKDDQFTPAKQALNLKELAQQDKVFAIVGVPDAAVSAQWPTIERLGVPMWGPIFPQDPKIENAFIMGSTIAGQTSAVMSSVCKKFGGKPFTVASVMSETPYGETAQTGIEESAKECPGMTVGSEQVVPVTETNLAPVVLKMKSGTPDVVYMGVTSYQDLLMMKEAGQQGFEPVFVGNNSTMAQEGTELLPNLQDKAYRGSTILASGPGVEEYEAAMSAIGEKLNPQAEEEYAITKALLQTIKNAGEDLSWEHFIKTAEELKYDSKVMSPITFGPLPDGHRSSTGVVIQEVKGNKWVDVGGFVEPSAKDNEGL
jgi:branched-chain amino acid transport system substrate-binding protein